MKKFLSILLILVLCLAVFVACNNKKEGNTGLEDAKTYLNNLYKDKATNTPSDYEMTYIVDGENVERPVVETFLATASGDPIYCGETLVKHVESGHFDGTAFDVGTRKLYEQIYYYLTEGKPMTVTADMAADVISVIETVHAQNPLPLKY